VKIVLDTNVFWVSISRRSRSHLLFQRLLEGKYSLCVTTDILNEYEEIIGQKLGKEITENTMKVLDNLQNVEFVTKFFRWQLIADDYDDNKFSDCAAASNADYLVTNDGHFDVLKSINFPKINVISMEEFLKVLNY